MCAAIVDGGVGPKVAGNGQQAGDPPDALRPVLLLALRRPAQRIGLELPQREQGAEDRPVGRVHPVRGGDGAAEFVQRVVGPVRRLEGGEPGPLVQILSERLEQAGS